MGIADVAQGVARNSARAIKAVNIALASAFLVVNVWFSAWWWPVLDGLNKWPIPSQHDYLNLAIPAIGLLIAAGVARIRRLDIALPLGIATLIAILVAAYLSILPSVAGALVYGMASA